MASRTPAEKDISLYRKLPLSYALKILLALLGVLQGIVLARALGPSGRGIYAVSVAFIAVATQCANCGQLSAVVFFASRKKSSHAIILQNCLWHALVIGSAVGFIVLPFGAIFATELDQTLLLSVSLLVPFSLAYQLLRAALLAEQKVYRFNIFEVCSQILGFTLLCLFTYSHALTPTRSFLALRFSSSLLGCILLLTHFSLSPLPRQRFDFELAREMFPYGFRAFLFGLLSSGVSECNIFLVNYSLPIQMVGWYALAERCTRIFGIVSLPIVQLLWPHLAAEQHEEVRGQNWVLTTKLALAAGGTGLLLAIILSFFLHDIILLLYGENFLPATNCAVIILFSQTLRVVTDVLISFLNAKGIPNELLQFFFLAVPLQVFLSLLLLPRYGIEGAAASYFLTQMFLLNSVFLTCRQQMRTTGETEGI